MEMNLDRIDELAKRLGQLAKGDGVTPSLLKNVSVFRISQPTKKAPIIYEPCLIIVGQGVKHTYLSDQTYSYNPKQYLILSVPLPVEAEVRVATPDAPFLSLKITFDMALLRHLLLEMDEQLLPKPSNQVGISASKLPDAMLDAALRLVRVLPNAHDCQILGSLYLQEILYLALKGEQGHCLRSVAMKHGQYQRIANVLQMIHANYSDSLSVETMAEMANMSESTFYANFKTATSLSPIQYLKTIRLHQARTLMVQRGLNAGEVAYQVGYSSASQFSREFKRLFGYSPTETTKRLQAGSVSTISL